ncbi:MAG: ATP-binding protein [Candidatus Binatia bacterium]
MPDEDLGLLLKQERGQFFAFISAYGTKKAGVQRKKCDDLAREIVRVLTGMANSDGGTLLVGVEPDKSVTGVPHTSEEVQVLIGATSTLSMPPLNAYCQRIHLGNLLLLKFEVTSGFEIHRVAGGRTFYRIATETPSLPSEQIQSLKEGKKSYFYERQHIAGASWKELDPSAIQAFLDKVQDPRDSKVVLNQTYHLIDNSFEKPSITMAALLLFGKDPSRWHPRCGIDFIKYEGTERQHGTSLNIIKRIRFEAPLFRLIDEAVGRIKEHIRERTVLYDLFFRERLEYPTYAWQETLVNAVAHRDYGLVGTSVEICMFDDRIEVRSPGLPPSPVTLDQLRQRKRIHFSRNPLLTRVLTDLGYMREIGEGIPRIFQEMEHYVLRPPEFSTEGFFFIVTLRNTPIYDDATLQWLNQFGISRINFRQRRLLVYAYSHGKSFSSADYQTVGEVDRDTAYREIRSMIKLGIVTPLKPKSRAYRIVERL